MKFYDLSDMIFGDLYVLKRCDPPTDRKLKSFSVWWLCICTCGNYRKARSASLKRGVETHCGCKTGTNRKRSARTHGMSKSPEYKTWADMKRRCKNPNDNSAAYYYDKGIKVCDRWQSFELFYKDMGPKPSPWHTIERIDSDGDYEPNNCCWIHRSKQNLNTEQNILVEYHGEVKTLKEWSDIIDLEYATLYHRIVYKGMTIEQAAVNVVQNFSGRKPKLHDYHGTLFTVKEIANLLCISTNVVHRRLRAGMSIEDIVTLYT